MTHKAPQPIPPAPPRKVGDGYGYPPPPPSPGAALFERALVAIERRLEEDRRQIEWMQKRLDKLEEPVSVTVTDTPN